ncbi:hypothetical protein RIVM261_027510 [Rivularia sp. IAM M-261]|nr:hypothetical protein CAL7716_013410 [Calothrix sp. PCC 7716]GJD17795.1 hypothetical protein RIVM261_027510 [Rivularia sp. IAM M-261]
MIFVVLGKTNLLANNTTPPATEANAEGAIALKKSFIERGDVFRQYVMLGKASKQVATAYPNTNSQFYWLGTKSD